MLKTEQFVTLLVLSFLSCDALEITCPESTRPHKTECNKYFKCIKLPSNRLSWITLTCQEGLIYDKNLRSCAIPTDDWDCNLSKEQVDGDNIEKKNENDKIHDIKNLDPFGVYDDENANDSDNVREDSDEFLEIIDGDKDLKELDGKSRKDDFSEYTNEDYSGDGNIENFVTTLPPTIGMVTAQVQRLSQLIQNIPKNNNDISPDDLNAYLASQKIQSKSPEYQSINFNSDDKTTVPADGKVHPDIQTEIISRQNELNMRLTTLSMDKAIPTTSVRPFFYINKDPVTEIKLKSGDGLEGIGSHQIVVNRPEGSVMFNVPSATDNSNIPQKSQYLSEDVLKTILEISKQMISQKTSGNHEIQHPIYYAFPFPVIPPQNHVQNYYGQYPNQTVLATTETPFFVTEPILPTKRIKLSNNNNNHHKKPYSSYKEQNSDYKVTNILKNSQHFDNPNSYESAHQSHNQYSSVPTGNPDAILHPSNYPHYNQYPLNHYSPFSSNYPQTYHQFYNSIPFHQYFESDRYNAPTNFNQFSNYNGAYYGNRPLVSDSSTPFLDHSYSVKQNPYRKESFFLSPSYENNDYDLLNEESDDDSEKSEEEDVDNEDSDEDQAAKGPTSGLICTNALARQANKTDCFQYYVCNAKTKEVLSYTCPAFTAFNDQTKYCDSGMYKSCKKAQDAIEGSFKNNKMYAEAHKALLQAKRESQKVERIANLVKKQSQQIIYNSGNQVPDVYEDESSSYYAPSQIQQRPAIVPQRRKQVYKTRPKVVEKAPLVAHKSNRRKRKQVKCIVPGNIADPDDLSSYWHCFKSPDGRMKRIHKKCASSLKFCSDSKYCSPRC